MPNDNWTNKKITDSCFQFFFETRQLLSSSIPEWYQQTKTRLCQTKGFIFITMKIIVQGTHWWVLINKSTDVPLDTVAKKLNNIVVLQSWDGLYLQQEMKLEHNPFLQIWTKCVKWRVFEQTLPAKGILYPTPELQNWDNRASSPQISGFLSALQGKLEHVSPFLLKYRYWSSWLFCLVHLGKWHVLV